MAGFEGIFNVIIWGRSYQVEVKISKGKADHKEDTKAVNHVT